MSAVEAPSRIMLARLTALAVRAWGLEKLVYTSIGRAITRRPAVPKTATGFAHHRSVLVTLVIFIVLSAVELVVLDVIVHRWPVVRTVCLVVGIWGLVWMIGLSCAHVMRPHTVGSDGVRVRDGMGLDAHVSWDDVASVAIRKRVHEAKTPRIAEQDGSPTLAVGVTHETNILIVLEGPTTVDLPGRAPKGGAHEVTTIRLWADEPQAFLAEVGRYI